MSEGPSSKPSHSEIAELRRKLAELEAFFEHSLVLLAIADKAGHYTRVNPAWEKTLGWSVAEIIGRHFIDLVHPDDRASTLEIAANSYAGGTIIAFENRCRCKDGSYRALRWYAGISDQDGSFHAFAQDVTEQHKAEARAQLYEDAIHNSSTGVTVMHLEEPGNPASLRLVMANDAASRMCGFDLKAEVGRLAIEVFPNNVSSGLADIYMRVAEEGGAVDLGEITYGDDRLQGIFTLRLYGLPDRRVCLNWEEISARKRAEEGLRKSLIQEEVIRAQAAALAELSTPLIPLSDEVVVMPLIGTLDSTRAAQVLDTLLAGITSRGASTAILDITGVAVVDTQVANAILQAAQAARLLGARVMLTGIRPEVARTLVDLGVDLGGITTHGSLQAGIATALRRRGI